MMGIATKAFDEAEAVYAAMFHRHLLRLISKNGWELDEDVERLVIQENNLLVIDRLFHAAIDLDRDGFQEQVRRESLGKAVFFNPNVLRRLEESENAREEDEISNFEEYMTHKKQWQKDHGK